MSSGIGRTIRVIRAAADRFSRDDCGTLAAAIAFYALLSLFPFILAVISISALVLSSTLGEDAIVAAVVSYLPGAAELVASNVQEVLRSRGTATVIGLIGLIWSALGVFGSVRHALNRTLVAPTRRGIVHQKLVDLAMLLALAVMLAISITLTAVIQVVRAFEIPVLGLRPLADETLWAVNASLIPLAVSFALFALLYRFVPNVQVRWRESAAGAALASPLFEASKHLFAWYTQQLGRYELVYGSLGTVIGLLVWIYLSAMVLLLGAELAAVIRPADHR